MKMWRSATTGYMIDYDDSYPKVGKVIVRLFTKHINKTKTTITMKYDIPSALQILTPGAEWVLRGSEYSGLEWILGNGHDKPTEAALTAKIAELDGAEAMRLLRVERDKRLAKDDWKVVKAKETGSILLLLLRPIARHLETFLLRQLQVLILIMSWI